MMESRLLMDKRHAMEKAQSALRTATSVHYAALASVAVALVSFFGSIGLNALNVIGDGTAWAWGGCGTVIFGFLAGGLFVFIDEDDVSTTTARIAFERAQRDYFDQLEGEVMM